MKAIVKKPNKFNIPAAKHFADDEAQEDWFEAKQKQPQYSKLMILDQLGPAIMKNEIFSPDDQSMVSYKIQKAFQNIREIYGNQHDHKKYFKNYSLHKTSLRHNEKKVKLSDFHIQPVTAVDIFKLTRLNQKIKSNGKGFQRYPFNPAGIYLLKVNKETLEHGVKYVQS